MLLAKTSLQTANLSGKVDNPVDQPTAHENRRQPRKYHPHGGQTFFALTLLLVAVAAGFGGTALLVYNHLDKGSAPADHRSADRKTVGQSREKAPGVTQDDTKLRPVAAAPSDQPRYTYADNIGGQPSVPAKHDRPAANVPGALENPVPADGSAVGLNDPESHYIVDERTGRVVGIDGSAGARREEAEEQRRLEAAPRAVAVQTPTPEVRVASAVVEDGQPVYRDGQTVVASESSPQYFPVRRAQPVTDDAADTEPSGFNVGEYMAGGESRPVLRAQPVVRSSSVAPRTLRAYRLSDDSQIVSTN